MRESRWHAWRTDSSAPWGWVRISTGPIPWWWTERAFITILPGPANWKTYLNAMPEHPDRTALLERAAALLVLILEKELTKYNTGFRAALPPKFPEGKKIVLVPGQVEDDASVRCGGFGMANLDLLRAVREARPDAFIVYKPHPDVERGNRQGVIPETETRRYADATLRGYPMGRLLFLDP